MKGRVRATDWLRAYTENLGTPVGKYALIETAITDGGFMRRSVVPAMDDLFVECWLQVQWTSQGVPLVIPGPRHPLRSLPMNTEVAP